MKVVLFIHSFTQAWRHTVILSGFGSISYCKHSPTCSEYTLQKVKENGVVLGIMKGIWRALRCW